MSQSINTMFYQISLLCLNITLTDKIIFKYLGSDHKRTCNHEKI